MCLLNFKQIKPEGEITCYKVLMKYIWKDGVSYSSPCYTFHTWEIGKTRTIPSRQLSGGIMPYIWLCPDENDKDVEFIGCGAYHTFKNLEDAKKLLSLVREKFPNKDQGPITGYALAKCTIPKDSSYVLEGVCNMAGDWRPESYASEKLRVDEIIDEPAR